MLPKEAVNEFKAIYKKVFKTELSDAEATRKANNLIDLYAAILRIPQPQAKSSETNDQRARQNN